MWVTIGCCFQEAEDHHQEHVQQARCPWLYCFLRWGEGTMPDTEKRGFGLGQVVDDKGAAQDQGGAPGGPEDAEAEGVLAAA